MKFRTQQKGFQLTLDCGQKEFGSTKCLQCHMVYTPGDKEDIKAHKKYHQFKLFPFVRLPRGRHQQVIQENLNGSRVVELLTDCRLGQGFYERISSLLNKEFGYDQPLRKSNSSCVNGSGMSLCPDWRVFVHVIDRTQQVVGCCVVEELTTKKILTKGYKLNRLIGGRKALLSWSIQSADQNQTNHNSIPYILRTHYVQTLADQYVVFGGYGWNGTTVGGG
ncbi:unnamed protein product [Heterobilharzia americana]|nr:unnamed protein product [Heterobilharzia americana]